jgi:chromosome partitioning protein
MDTNIPFNKVRLVNKDIVFLFDCGSTSPSLWASNKITNPIQVERSNSKIKTYGFEDTYNIRHSVKIYEKTLPINKVFSPFTWKGGSSKTTTLCQIGLGLALMGYKVLLIDSDYQTSLTKRLGLDPRQTSKTIGDVVLHDIDIKETIVELNHNLSVIPAHKNLADLDRQMLLVDRRLFKVESAIETIRDDYDFIFFDMHPGKLQINSSILYALDRLLMPTKCDAFGFEGVEDCITYINEIFETPLDSEGLKKFAKIIPSIYKKGRPSEQRYLQIFEETFPMEILPYMKDSNYFVTAADAALSVFNMKDKVLLIKDEDDIRSFLSMEDLSFFIGLNTKSEDAIRLKELLLRIIAFSRET